LNRYFVNGDALLRKIRNKIAYHIDQEVLDGAYERLPRDWELVDFHSSVRGSTFFGCADNVAAVAISELLDKSIAEATSAMMDEVIEVSGWVSDFAYGYMVAFALTYLSGAVLRQNAVVLRDAPVADRNKLVFFMRPGPAARRA
jgi:hypothetical protein